MVIKTTVEISEMDDKDRENEMNKIFGELFNKKPEEIVEELESMITDMRKATDDNYLKLCLTNLGITSNLSDEKLKDFVSLRLKANSRLPDYIKNRDMQILQKAIKQAPAEIRDRVLKFMK
ncbi:MAG: hypothetical protein QXZ44_07190 [Ferroplasma sp.]